MQSGAEKNIDLKSLRYWSSEMGTDSLSAGCMEDKCAHYSKIKGNMQKLQGINSKKRLKLSTKKHCLCVWWRVSENVRTKHSKRELLSVSSMDMLAYDCATCFAVDNRSNMIWELESRCFTHLIGFLWRYSMCVRNNNTLMVAKTDVSTIWAHQIIP